MVIKKSRLGGIDKVEGRTRPGANSLRLLPLGPDRIGEATARADLPA